nr:MAG TPA: hypothetical protein [Caudoviricetes sp.]
MYVVFFYDDLQRRVLPFLTFILVAFYAKSY